MLAKTSPAEQAYHAILLGRLQRLIRVQREYRGELNDIGDKLLSRAITASYGDCVNAGIEDLARPIPRLQQKGTAGR